MAEQPQPAPSQAQPEARRAELGALGERLGSAARDGVRALAARRGMALTLVGCLVLAAAWLGERDSAWGFPMLVAGGAMVGIGIVGPRLSGSLALRWGEDGAYFQLTSAIAPPGKRHEAPRLTDPEPQSEPRELPDKLIPPSEIESSAETIDFKAAES